MQPSPALRSLCVALVVVLGPGLGVAATPEGTVRQMPVGPGDLRPAFRGEKEAATKPVGRFLLDVDPVSNTQFLDFVRKNPRWQRGAVPAFLADGNYLTHWLSPLDPGKEALQRPATRVSWFAAKAFCEARGARLPTELEWEFAAAADETRKDATDDAKFLERILQWYAHPAMAARNVGTGPANVWGVRDLHGLVWEWVLDFNASMVTGDGRTVGDADFKRICGAGSLGARDASNYAAFMRTAMRSSLEAAYTTPHLGFRCARDIDARPRR